MNGDVNLLEKQIGLEIINGKKLQPIHTFYRFRVYKLHDGNLSPEGMKYRFHYQIEGKNLKVVVKLYLNSKDEIFVKYFRLKGTDAELAQYCVEYWLQHLQAENKFGNKVLVKNLAEF
jgi:hypothetical protein